MVTSGWATSRDDAVRIGIELQESYNLFEHVVDPQKHPFQDGYLFFRFNVNNNDIDNTSSSTTTLLSESMDATTKSISSLLVSPETMMILPAADDDDLSSSSSLGLQAVGGILLSKVPTRYKASLDCY